MPFGNRIVEKLREERAFGLIEALMAMTIMTLVLVALLGLLVVSVRAVTSSKLSTIATQIANESIEKIRAMDYSLVGIYGRDTNGALSMETKVSSNTTFTVTYDVAWVDDTADGTGTADATDDAANKGHDYKQVFVTVSWLARDTTQTVTASTYVKTKPLQTDPPTVNFVCGAYNPSDPATPPDGTIFGLDSSPYKDWFELGTIPLKATATDSDGDLVTMRFVISYKTPAGAYYNVSPTGSYANSPICFWNPNTMDTTSGAYMWDEGMHEVTVEVWDTHGNRDAKNIFWTIDRYAPDAPVDLECTQVNETTLNLAWPITFDGSSAVNRYQIYRSGPNQSGNFSLVTESTFTTTTFNNIGLSAWSTYEYYIKAVSPGGRVSGASNTATTTTMFGITCTLSGNKKSTTVQWDAPPVGVNVDSFDVLRNGVVVGSVSGSTTQFVNTLPAGSGTYVYQVKAYNGTTVVNQSATRSVSN